MTDNDGQRNQMRKAFWRATLTTLAGLSLALLCLRQWGAANPWSRIDLYSGGFLLTALLVRIGQAGTFHRSAFRSKEVLQEALGGGYDPDPLKLWTVLPMADLLVMLDYAHWHLLPRLEQHALQNAGLALCGLVTAWMFWTDIHLARHFSAELSQRKVMSQGPFGLVRHPRYAGILLTKLAAALVFASPIGWVLLACWSYVIHLRIGHEEVHLRELFGAAYEAHARQTARLIPGIY